MHTQIFPDDFHLGTSRCALAAPIIPPGSHNPRGIIWVTVESVIITRPDHMFPALLGCCDDTSRGEGLSVIKPGTDSIRCSAAPQPFDCQFNCFSPPHLPALQSRPAHLPPSINLFNSRGGGLHTCMQICAEVHVCPHECRLRVRVEAPALYRRMPSIPRMH